MGKVSEIISPILLVVDEIIDFVEMEELSQAKVLLNRFSMTLPSKFREIKALTQNRFPDFLKNKEREI